MANAFRGEVSIADGAYRLVCDFNALCEIEGYFDDDIDAALQKIDAGNLTLKEQRAVVAALLRHHMPGVNSRIAGEIIGEAYEEMREAILRTIALAMPEPDPEKKPARRETAQD
ncbi:hypothetical protein [Pseudogemmobacter faecipullorum]|uniref:Uncharacterized protein n=1 Tax=Pseudogemmobacter faecipullorum TaxID=2755041 RepID=A0ABS8CT17_9RHOB|nr:hypothetical protein [Pseudogemmobacter faecipullorum]MCB5412348.1 hypothetical protein [Pseudogemmobacter faecipullorum]